MFEGVFKIQISGSPSGKFEFWGLGHGSPEFVLKTLPKKGDFDQGDFKILGLRHLGFWDDNPQSIKQNKMTIIHYVIVTKGFI